MLNEKKKKEMIKYYFLQRIESRNNYFLDDKNILKNNPNLINIKDFYFKTIKNQKNKGMKHLIGNIINFTNFVSITKYILIIFNLFNSVLLNNKISLFEYKSYNITLKIKGIGIKNIFSNNFANTYNYGNYPDDVYINGFKQERIANIYNLNKANNFIELVWYNLINDFSFLFYSCHDITEIDFSNFNMPEVKRMDCMFYDCLSLISLNLSNFDVSKVTSMAYIFFGCTSLISLDLSSFVTSDVEIMRNMFSGCSSLISLNLSNFITSDVENMQNMFSGCSSLISLNLSTFNTSKVRKISNMFDGCMKLEYVNMINFNEISLSQNENYKDIFIKVPDNIALCINKSNIPKIYPEIENKTGHSEYCPDNWKLEEMKLIRNLVDGILNDINIEISAENKSEEINNYNKILEIVESIFINNDNYLSEIDDGKDKIINNISFY